jgi:hypothetical protein
VKLKRQISDAGAVMLSDANRLAPSEHLLTFFIEEMTCCRNFARGMGADNPY